MEIQIPQSFPLPVSGYSGQTRECRAFGMEGELGAVAHNLIIYQHPPNGVAQTARMHKPSREVPTRLRRDGDGETTSLWLQECRGVMP